MRISFYPRLAWTGVRKNKRLYTPYILTCIGMVMMYYIIAFLADSDVLAHMKGGEIMQSMLQMGTGVMSIFSLIFLFYTNSFLIRRRKKEFGLYNILGMGKWNLARILIWESLMIAALALGGGLAAGITFSKLAELGMVNILHVETDFSLTLSLKAIWETMIRFVVIFFLILLNMLRQIHLSNPIQLLRSEQTGEKPPKANWILALLGIIILGAAYYIAVSIENPVETLIWFFVAVVMVICATYLLFVAGSVALCRLLQKKKSYYYKTNHFVSLSSMVYRMKRNGAGLASICILCTMVLVMLSSTVCLYMGTEGSLRARYPRNINLDAALGSPEEADSEMVDQVRELAEQAAGENSLTLSEVLDYRITSVAGCIEGNRILLDIDQVRSFSVDNYAAIWQIFFVSLEDYNHLMGQEETLSADEVLIYTTKTEYEGDTIRIGDQKTFRIKKRAVGFVNNRVDAMQVIPSMYIFLPDYNKTITELAALEGAEEGTSPDIHWIYGFDMDGSEEEQIRVQERLEELLREKTLSGGGSVFYATVEGVAKERADFYGLYGGLFFLGILLSVVFLFAAVLLMYYKQVSEGYEDQARFEIMQKVGMTKTDIRRSINSQILTVFFLPLLMAGVHLAFAFPMIYKLLILFGLMDLKLLILTTVGGFLIFTVFYVLVYRITSKAYYHIVSEGKERYN